MFREIIVHKWDIVTIHSRLLRTIPRMLGTCYRFYWTSGDHKQHHQLCCVTDFLVYRRLEKFYAVISSVIDLSNTFVDWKCFKDWWCLMDAFRLNYFIRSGQVHSNNTWHKFHGSIRKFFGCMDHNLAWLYFFENDIFDGPPTLSIRPLQWRLSLQNQHNDLFKNIVFVNSWKINLDRDWAPIPSLHKTTVINDLPHSVSMVSITACYSIMVWVFGHYDYTFIPYLACCIFKIATRCKEQKALIFKVDTLDFILLIISIALSEIDMY